MKTGSWARWILACCAFVAHSAGAYTLTVINWNPGGSHAFSYVAIPFCCWQQAAPPDTFIYASADLAPGTVVNLDAYPEVNYWFEWGGDCGGIATRTCTLTMDADRTVYIAFMLVGPANLYLTVHGNGAIQMPYQADCAGSCVTTQSTPGHSPAWSYTYSYTAYASPGSSFVGWDGVCSGTGVCTFMADTAGATYYLDAYFQEMPSATTTTLVTSRNPVPPPGLAVLTATVTNDGTYPAPTGTVTFVFDGSFRPPACTGVPLSGGMATCALDKVWTFGGYAYKGVHTVVASYSGDNINGASLSSPITQLITATPLLDANGDLKSDIYWIRNSDNAIGAWLMDGTTILAQGPVMGGAAGVMATKAGDFDGDGKTDLVRQFADGSVSIYLMDGFTTLGSAQIVPPGSPLRLTIVGDFDGDGKSDLVFTNLDGSTEMWLIDGTTVKQSAIIMPAAIAAGWYVELVGDFDGDGKSDLIWTNPQGGIGVWTMDGVTATNKQVMFYNGSGWTATHVGDFNGDGKSDVLFVNANGSIGVWLMDGAFPTYLGTVCPAGTTLTPLFVGDFNGDGHDDILLRDTDGSTTLWLMANIGPYASGVILPGGTGWTAVGLADLDGDGKKDILWQAADGSKGAWIMNGTVTAGGGVLVTLPAYKFMLMYGADGLPYSFGSSLEQNH